MAIISKIHQKIDIVLLLQCVVVLNWHYKTFSWNWTLWISYDKENIILLFDSSIKFDICFYTWSRSISSCMSMHLKNSMSPNGTTNSNNRTLKWFPIVIRVTAVVLLLLPLPSFSSTKNEFNDNFLLHFYLVLLNLWRNLFKASFYLWASCTKGCGSFQNNNILFVFR